MQTYNGMTTRELRERMEALPEPVTDKQPPFWEYWRWELYNKVLNEDPQSFLGWPCIYHTMLVNHWGKEMEYELAGVSEKYFPAIEMPNFGIPKDFHPGTLFSRNMIHQAFHLSEWEWAQGNDIARVNSVFEFGGGYGAMALLWHRMGFQGEYFIYDLPEFCLLQEYYLSQFGIKVVHLQDGDKVTMPTVDMLLALYSLSEAPIDLREQILMDVRAKNYLFLYSRLWEEYDNHRYFVDWADHIGLDWQAKQEDHLPPPNDVYLFGKR